MTEINFFRPIFYGAHAKTASEKAIENVDSYFHIGGKKAFVIPNRIEEGKQVAVLSETKFYKRIATRFNNGIAISEGRLKFFNRPSLTLRALIFLGYLP